jgi:hypothetical protein
VFGIHPADKTPTSHQPPSSQSDTVVENTPNHSEHRIRALNHMTGKTSKPADAYGVRYAWQAVGDRSASGEDLPKSHFSRKPIIVIVHTEAEKGRRRITRHVMKTARAIWRSGPRWWKR